MSYPDDGDPVGVQVLDALVATLAAIAPPSFHHTMTVSRLYEGAAIESGISSGAFACVIPESDTKDDATTGMIKHQMELTIFAGLVGLPGSTAWKKELRWLLTDIGQAIEANKQLNGTCAYIEPLTEDMYDADSTAPLILGSARYRIAYRHAWDNPSLVT